MNYLNWEVYLNEINENNNEKDIEMIYNNFFLCYPFSFLYKKRFYNILLNSNKRTLKERIINEKEMKFSSFLWYERLSILITLSALPSSTTPSSSSSTTITTIVTTSNTLVTKEELISLAMEASQFLCGHFDAYDSWRLILYIIQLHGTLLQIIYCYWKAFSQPIPYFNLIRDLFLEFQSFTNLTINSSNISIAIIQLPTPVEEPFIIKYYSDIINLFQINNQQSYNQQSKEYEQRIHHKYFEDEVVLQSEINLWHQYLSHEEFQYEKQQQQQQQQYKSSSISTSLPSSDQLIGVESIESPTSELICLQLCQSKLLDNSFIRESLEDNRKYNRIIQLYERCLLVCACYPGM